MAKYNNYGLLAAKRRAKLKAKAEEQQAVSKSAKKTPSEPKIDWNPLAKAKMPKFEIDWSDEQTNKHARVLIKKDDDIKMRMLTMPTGTGKTAVVVRAIALLQEELGEPIPFVVTAPTQVVDGMGWQNTIFSWNENNPDNPLHPILITTTDKFANIGSFKKTMLEVAKRLGKHGMIVLDEAHAYKNSTSKRSKQLQKFARFDKICLTATPLTNNVIMDSASYLIIAGYYKNKTAFMRESDLEIWVDNFGRLLVYDDDGRINKQVWPYYDTLMEQWSNVLYKPSVKLKDFDMPNVTKNIISLDFNQDLVDDMNSLLHAYKKRMFDSFVDYFMEYVDRLHSDELRLQKLREILEQKDVRQPLIFFQHKSVQDSIQNLLDEMGLEYQVIDGQHSIKDVDLEKDTPILIQYSSGNKGIELKHSNTSIFYQNQTSYDVLLQSVGRNVRRGMTDEINHYYIVADESVDRELFERVSKREEVSEEMLREIVLMSDGNLKP